MNTSTFKQTLITIAAIFACSATVGAQEKQLLDTFQTTISGYTDVELVEELKRRSLAVEGPEWGP